METLYLITNTSYDNMTVYLKSSKEDYLSMLTHQSEDVLDVCWTNDRTEARGFNETEVQDVIHGVESILMVPDNNFKWELK